MIIKFAWWPTQVEPKDGGYTKVIWLAYYAEYKYELMETTHIIRQEL